MSGRQSRSSRVQRGSDDEPSRDVTHHTHGVVLLVTIWLFPSCAPGDAFTTRTIDNEITCGSCSLVTSTVAVLGIPANVDESTPLAVRQDQRGRYWALRAGGALPLLFDSDGRFLHAVGTIGAGPGEFIGATEILPIDEDSVVVLDGRARRATVLDADLVPLRTINLPFGVHSAHLVAWPDSILVNSSSTPNILLVSLGGREAQVRVSFVVESDSTVGERLLNTRHVLAAPRDDLFWSAWSSAYDLRQWALDGSPRRELHRRPTWFAGIARSSYDWRNEPPPSFVGGATVDSTGLLWTLSKVPAPTWREAWAHAPPHANEAAPVEELLYETVVEVLDTRKMTVILRQVIARYPIGMMPDGRVAFYDTDDRGARITVMRLTMGR